VEIDSAWGTIRENINIAAKESLGYLELKKNIPLFDEGCSKLLDERKQAKLQWLKDPSEISGDNLNNVRCEASRYFRNKKREYLKDKINELATNSKNKNIRDLHRGISLLGTIGSHVTRFKPNRVTHNSQFSLILFMKRHFDLETLQAESSEDVAVF
jgi:hypothetical protein